MGSIAALLFGTFISAGIFFLNPDNPQHILRTPAIAEVPAPTGGELQTGAKKEMTPVETAPSLSVPIATVTTSGKAVDGRDKDQKASVPSDKEVGDGEENDEVKSDIGERISKELQTLVENYWLDKINGYKARIDGMLSRSDLDELNRLRVRWALVDKEESPFGFGAMMQMNAVNANGEKAQFKTLVGNSDDVESTELPEMEGGGNGEVSIAFGMQSKHVDGSITDDEDGRVEQQNKEIFIFRNDQKVDPAELEDAEDERMTIVIDKGPEIADQGDRAIIIRKSQNGQTASQNMPAFTIDSEIDADEFESIKRVQTTIVIDENTDVTVDDQGNRTVILRREEMGKDAEGMEEESSIESLDMTPLIGMVKMSIRSDEHESSRILVAAWDMAEDHRPGLDDLKATVKGDVKVFIELVRKRMTDFVAEHGDELPAEMRDLMVNKLGDEGGMDRTGGMIESLAPFYDVIVEPMLLLYNGSDINGILTSAIAEPVAGVTLGANATLKQSYPNPASTEATIEYTLQEASPSTVLRLFDAQGAEVRSVNLGAQGEGHHQATLDVQNLPGGTYLYHLTIGTPRGEQVFSKTMQITR